MAPHLFSIDKAPKGLPVWEAILDDLGNPPAHRIARALGVGRSTVYHWSANGGGPRIASLALFWLTRWGRSLVATDATNDAVLYVQLARSLTEERDQLRHDLGTLERHYREVRYLLGQEELSTHQRGAASALAVAVAPGLATAALAWPAIAAREEPEIVFPDLGLDLGLGLDSGLDVRSTTADQVNDRRCDGPPHVLEVVRERNNDQGIERQADRLAVGAGLGLQGFGESDGERHDGVGVSERYQDDIIVPPSIDFPPVLQAGGATGPGRPAQALHAQATSHPSTDERHPPGAAAPRPPGGAHTSRLDGPGRQAATRPGQAGPTALGGAAAVQGSAGALTGRMPSGPRDSAPRLPDMGAARPYCRADDDEEQPRSGAPPGAGVFAAIVRASTAPYPAQEVIR